jgi:hypothetical protein
MRSGNATPFRDAFASSCGARRLHGDDIDLDLPLAASLFHRGELRGVHVRYVERDDVGEAALEGIAEPVEAGMGHEIRPVPGDVLDEDVPEVGAAPVRTA